MQRRVLPLVILLLVLGAGGTLLRSRILGYPLFPRITERVWEAELSVHWEPGQAPISVLLPRSRPRQEIVDERFLSGPLETAVGMDPSGNRRVLWEGEEAVTAAYRAQFVIRRPGSGGGRGPSLEELARWRRTDEYPLPRVAAAARLAAALAPGGAARGCFDLLAGSAAAPRGLEAEAAQVRAAAPAAAGALVLCWRAAGLPARLAQAFPLHTGLYTRPGMLAEVLEGNRWVLADPDGKRFPARERRWLTWAWGAWPLVEGQDARPGRWELELRERPLALWEAFFRQTANRASVLARWSLYALPSDVQQVFRVLLLVPIGALIVALLRNVVGFNTFGTFLPILIALAFRQTQLLYGLALFSLVVAAGYAVRGGIDRYKLLLVPRLSAILTFVIGCLAVLSLAGYRLGLYHVLSVGLLPMVILTMTIERFFVVTEESGIRAALQMAGGTAAVAAIAYATISWEYLQLVFFTYPELLFVVAAAQIALGRYVGYRLTELWRFRHLGGAS